MRNRRTVLPAGIPIDVRILQYDIMPGFVSDRELRITYHLLSIICLLSPVVIASIYPDFLSLPISSRFHLLPHPAFGRGVTSWQGDVIFTDWYRVCLKYSVSLPCSSFRFVVETLLPLEMSPTNCKILLLGGVTLRQILSVYS